MTVDSLIWQRAAIEAAPRLEGEPFARAMDLIASQRTGRTWAFASASSESIEEPASAGSSCQPGLTETLGQRLCEAGRRVQRGAKWICWQGRRQGV
jgi:hypothetical protein